MYHDNCSSQTSMFIGLLSIAKMLDRETVPEYNLKIQAADLGHPRHTSLTNLTVTVVDVNDNAPVFEKNLYTASIMEGNDTGVFITQVKATDKDEGNIIQNGKESQYIYLSTW